MVLPTGGARPGQSRLLLVSRWYHQRHVSPFSKPNSLIEGHCHDNPTTVVDLNCKWVAKTSKQSFKIDPGMRVDRVMDNANLKYGV